VVLGDRFGIADTQLHTDNPGNPEDYPVLGNLKSVSGNGVILFRLGMTGTYSPTSVAPARYARIILTTNDNTVTNYIYVRQGEEPDYLMRPTDIVQSGMMTGQPRTKARKFSPYNLRAATLNAQVGVNGNLPNPGIFSQYPTQAGAFFQWANIGVVIKRWAWAPHVENAAGFTTVGVADSGVYWDAIAHDQETCPTGYRRPTDGATHIDVTSSSQSLDDPNQVLYSELLQSLWEVPSSALGSAGTLTTGNFAHGYYADGFFDRRPIGSPEVIGSLDQNSTVAQATPSVAYRGILFYNPANRASLFFPAAGHRSYNSSPAGKLSSSGYRHIYWTSSSSSSTTAWSLNGAFEYPLPNLFNAPSSFKSNAQPIRCVRPDIMVSAQSLWLSPSPVNSSKTIQIESNSGWTLVGPPPTNASLSATNGGPGISTLTLTRNSTVGLSSFTIATASGETAVISVDSFFIEEDELTISNALLTGNIGTYTINVVGGSGKFIVDGSNYSSWITSATVLPSGQLQLIANQSPDEEERTGFVTLAHADDPTYTVTFDVLQTLYALDPFDYLVFKFTWINNDVDIAVRFSGNGAPFDNSAVGWSFNTSVPFSGQNLLQWGGDATGGQGETVFVNTPILEGVTTLPRYLTMQVYATWYTAGRAPDAVTLTITTYKGGTMLQSGTNFNNIGGTLIFSEGFPCMVTTYRGNGTYSTGGYTRLCDVVYDRVKHSAKITWYAII